MSQDGNKLEPLLNPRSVAFIGASNDPGKWGFIILSNLLHGKFPGKIYLVNPRQKEILGMPVYPSIAEIPETPDMAVIVIPPPSVPQVIQDCLDKGIRAGLVITAGFAEVDDQGQQLQRDMVHLARQGGMVLAGPNCNGILSPYSQFYCTMPTMYPQPGQLAIVSQSGNVAGSVAGDIMSRGFGISHFISSGNEADLHTADFLEYLEQHEPTKVILSYVEGFRDGRRLFEVASRVTKKKPIVMLKAGDTSAGARAAKSHTASLAGSDSISEAACKQAGIIRVQNLDEMLNVGCVFLGQPLPKGSRIAIITRGGGWGVLAADACARAGLEVAMLSEKVLNELDKYLPPWWTRSNPVDMVAGLGEDISSNLLNILLSSPEIDGVITLGLSRGRTRPSGRTDPAKGKDASAQDELDEFGLFLKDTVMLRERYQKPVVVVANMSLGGGEMAADLATLTRETQTAFFTAPHQAANAYAALASYAQYLREVS